MDVVKGAFPMSNSETSTIEAAPAATPEAAKVGKPAKAAKAPKPKASGPREGSKTEKILALLRRPAGVTLGELVRATSWQPHSVRGFLSTADPTTFCTPLLHG
jgi:hypothetical protein